LASAFKRKPSNLEPIDGLRAIAIVWVFNLHSSIFITFKWVECLLVPYFWWFKPVLNGSLGVDIFFVISGFLINYLLLKEKDKYGRIDYRYFLRNRFFRIWPSLAIYIVFSTPFKILSGNDIVTVLKHLSSMLFVNNLFGKPLTHIWSVAVEFQFYLVSPYLIGKMNSLRVPILLCLISTVLNFAMTLGVFGGLYPDHRGG
jgi:peptidoglycan/LPS O-acetylase OafA/YrhL